MDNLVYEDDPWAYWRLPYRELARESFTRAGWTRGVPWSMSILPIMLVIFIVGLILAATQIEQEAIFFSIIGVTLFLMLITYNALRPTKYQIFNDRIRIVLGWVIHINIPFSNIEKITAATRNDLGVLNLNFINSYSGDAILQITRKRGAKINITPWNRKLFMENLNKAMDEWRNIPTAIEL